MTENQLHAQESLAKAGEHAELFGKYLRDAMALLLKAPKPKTATELLMHQPTPADDFEAWFSEFMRKVNENEIDDPRKRTHAWLARMVWRASRAALRKRLEAKKQFHIEQGQIERAAGLEEAADLCGGDE